MAEANDNLENWTDGNQQQQYEAVRQRRDKASSLMGQYMLKGYCMMNKYCADCQTILLRDKNNQEICVSCHIIDVKPIKQEEKKQKLTTESGASDTKDMKIVKDSLYQYAEEMRKEGVNSSKVVQDLPEDERPHGMQIPNFRKPIHTTNSTCNQRSVVQCTIEALHQQLQWANEMLPQLSSIDGRIQICNLIKVTSETLREIRSLAEPS